MLPNKGDTIELIEMPQDPNPIEPGSKGIVTFIQNLGPNDIQIGVDWESGRRLFLSYPLDKFKIIKKADL